MLTLHTNITQSMPFLPTRCTDGSPEPPPIPTGAGGFLRALPAMVPASAGNSRDGASIDSYYRSLSSPSSEQKTLPLTKDGAAKRSIEATLNVVLTPSSSTTLPVFGRRGAAAVAAAAAANRLMSTSTTLPASGYTKQTSSAAAAVMKQRSVSQSALHR